MNKNKTLILIIIITGIITLIVFLITKTTKYNNLVINEEKFNTIINSREEKDLVIEKIRFNDQELIIDNKTNNLYYSVVNNSKNKFNPNINLPSNLKIAFLENIDEEKTKNYEIKVIIYNNKYYEIYNLHCLSFPIINLTYREENKNRMTPTDIYIYDNLSLKGNRITRSEGEFNINKDGNYVINLVKLSPGHNERRNDLSILNMEPSARYILRKSNSMVENVPGRGRNVELFINNTYLGLYSINVKE